MLFCLQGFAQNVGVGINSPLEKLHIHGEASSISALRFSNNASNIQSAEGMQLGMVYVNAVPGFQYGFLTLQENLPFVLRQYKSGIVQRRLYLDSDGQFGLGSYSLGGFRLSVSGPTGIFPGLNQPATFMVLDSVLNSPDPVGIVLQKKSSGGKNFTVLSQGQDNAAYSMLQSDFNNGGLNSRSVRIQMDSTANVGIGNVTTSQLPSLRSNLHVFGNQRIEGNSTSPAMLSLHSEEGNFYSGSSIRFFYTPFESLLNPVSVRENFFLKLNDNSTSANVNAPRAFVLGKNTGGLANPPGVDAIGLVYNKSGQVGIRKYPDLSESSFVKVDIEGNTRINGKLLLEESAGSLSTMEFRNSGNYRGGFGWDEINSRFFFYDGESGTNTMHINNGRFGILRDPSTNAFEVNGNASKSTAGDWLANSDERLKKNITPLTSALNKLSQLQGITYEWNDTKTGNVRPSVAQMGFTAQNVEKVFPELVSKDAQGFLQTAYGTYDALYVEAIKELLKKVEVLEEKIKALENKN